MAASVPTSAARCYDERVETTPLLTTPLFAFLTAILLHALAMIVFPKIGLLDFPERYGLKRGRLPYPTGILGVAAFLLLFAFPNYPGTLDVTGYYVMACVLALAYVCFCDDRAKISPVVRLGAQASIAFTMFVAGARVYSLTNPLARFGLGELLPLDSWTVTFPDVGPLPIVSGVFTIVWLLLTINALNWFDGVAGQTSLLSTIGFLTIGFLSLSARVEQPTLAMIAFILAGVAGASALFELPLPLPKVVPGDSGAMFFGFMLGVLTIYAGGKVATGFLVLGVPLVDSFIVIVRRLAAGKNPMRGSAAGEHLHHRLLARGWAPLSVIALTSGLGAAFGIAALFLSTFEKFVAAVVLAAIIVALSVWSGTPRRSRA